MRAIEGKSTLQARTSHDIAFDSVHDEVAVPNPFAEAILFFHGDAKGDEAPIRVIQGPHTLLNYPDNVAVDPVHNEVYVALFRSDSIAVYSREQGGDVAPLRIIHGPKTKMDRPLRVTVDPVNNLLAVVTAPGIWFFNRTDNGDVAPRWILAGPKTGLGIQKGTRKVVLYPEGKKIIVGGGIQFTAREGQTTGRYFVGVWNYGDQGDIGPAAILHSTPATGMSMAMGIAINPEGKDLILAGSGKLLTYHIPELFQKTE